MKSTFLLFVLVFVLLASATPQQTEPPERALVIGVLRVLNIAEVTFAHDSGRFGTIDDLRPILARWQTDATKGNTVPLRGGDLKAVGAFDFKGMSPLPGWDLRVIPSPDGKHYSLAMKNKQYCDVIGVSDETGMLYNAALLGCEHKLPSASPAP